MKMDPYTMIIKRMEQERKRQERADEIAHMNRLREQALDDCDYGLYDYSDRRLRKI